MKYQIEKIKYRVVRWEEESKNIEGDSFTEFASPIAAKEFAATEIAYGTSATEIEIQEVQGSSWVKLSVWDCEKGWRDNPMWNVAIKSMA